MKKYYFILFCLLNSKFSKAQNAVLSLDKMNILYIGVDNPIEFAANKYDCKDLKIQTSNYLTVKCDDTCKCIARVTSQSLCQSITIFNKKNEIIKTICFRSKMIPDPIPVILNQSGGRVDCEKIFEWKELEIESKGFDFDGEFKIISFNVFFDDKDRWPYYLHNDGSKFGRDLQLVMNQISPGDIIYFEDIKVMGPDNLTRKIPGIAFKIE